MPTLPTARREDGAPSNWDRYLDLLAHRGVPEKMRPWYVRRVEGFLKARRPASLSQVTAEEIAGYLQEVSAQASSVGNAVRTLRAVSETRVIQRYPDRRLRWTASLWIPSGIPTICNQGRHIASRQRAHISIGWATGSDPSCAAINGGNSPVAASNDGVARKLMIMASAF